MDGVFMSNGIETVEEVTKEKMRFFKKCFFRRFQKGSIRVF